MARDSISPFQNNDLSKGLDFSDNKTSDEGLKFNNDFKIGAKPADPVANVALATGSP